MWSNKKLNFWGIPKCGNTSIKYILSDKEQKKLVYKNFLNTWGIQKYINFVIHEKWVHDPLISQYITKEEAMLNGHTNFTVLRNPIERFKSQFKYNRLVKITTISDVDKFLDFIEVEEEKTIDIHLKSQYSFIELNGVIIPKNIFKLERLDNLEEFLGHTLPVKNKTDDNIYLTNRQIDRIEKIYTKDFELYESK